MKVKTADMIGCIYGLLILLLAGIPMSIHAQDSQENYNQIKIF